MFLSETSVFSCRQKMPGIKPLARVKTEKLNVDQKVNISKPHSPAVNDKILHFDDTSMKLCHIPNLARTKVI